MKREFVTEGMGVAPAVVLVNPKFGHNASGALRACGAWGAEQLWITGQRIFDEWEGRGRLPREERMKDYGEVTVFRSDYPLDAFPSSVTPIGVEVLENAEPLAYFQHPENAIYVFGPEDGSLPKGIRTRCHRFVILPTRHCINLACAVNVVLAHRRFQRQLAGAEPVLPSYATLGEQRGWLDEDSLLVGTSPAS